MNHVRKRMIAIKMTIEATTVRITRLPIGALGNSWFTVAMSGDGRRLPQE
jgi:hypothetical protein